MKENRMEQDAIQEQIELRRKQAREERFTIVNRGRRPVYSVFDVTSASGRCNTVRIRSITERLNSCTCSDYRANTLRLCKHIEGALASLKKEFADRWEEFISKAPDVGRIYLNRAANTVRVVLPLPRGRFLRPLLTRCFDAEGILLGAPAKTLPSLVREVGKLPRRNRDRILIDQEVLDYGKRLEALENVKKQKKWFLDQVNKEARSLDLLLARLYNYQESGVLHLTFGRRVILGDDMGLGKTVQAIAAAALLKQLRDIRHVLIICPASLKHQWVREIRRLVSLSAQVIEGSPAARRDRYRSLRFFNIISYESVRFDEEEIAGRTFDLVILDEAQRIKNWQTRTAEGVMRLRAPRAFVLTGAPPEKMLDGLYSLFKFIDPAILGPRFRFQQEFYTFKQRASGSRKVIDHKLLAKLHRRIEPYMMRRSRNDVLLDLPRRVNNHYFVEMTEPRWNAHRDHERKAARLTAMARRDPLTSEERRELCGCLARMRLISNDLDPPKPGAGGRDRKKASPKPRELLEILDDSLIPGNRKVVIFSQWTDVLDSVAPVLDKLDLGRITLTSRVSPAERDERIKQFFNDPKCRVCLCTDAAAPGLNLKAADMVINMEPPWGPVTLAKRIETVHRRGQPHSINVVNLIARGSIEERMLDAPAARKSIFDETLNEGADDDLVFLDDAPGVERHLETWLGSRRAGPPAPGPRHKRKTGEKADELPASSNLDGYSDILVSRFPGRILLVQKAPRLPDAPVTRGVLVVVDREPARLRGVAQSLLDDYYGDAPAPALLMMEQEGWKSLLALMGEPMDRDAEAVTAYRSSSLYAPSRGDDRGAVEKRLRRANKGFDAADRRLELATLVLEGGFPGEAARPVRQALGWALSTHLFLGKGDEPGESPPSPRRVKSVLTAEGGVSTDLLIRLDHVRVLTAPPGDGDAKEPPPDDETMKGFIQDIRELIDVGRARVAGEALGD